VLEGTSDGARRPLDEAAREIDRQKDALLDEISKRLEQQVKQESLFTIRWQLA